MGSDYEAAMPDYRRYGDGCLFFFMCDKETLHSGLPGWAGTISTGAAGSNCPAANPWATSCPPYRPLGSDSFLSKLERALGRRLRPLPAGRPRKTAQTPKRSRK